MNISALLNSLRPSLGVEPPTVKSEKAAKDVQDIGQAMRYILTGQVSHVQTALLLYILSITGLEQRPEVLANSSAAMRETAVCVDVGALKSMAAQKRFEKNRYQGGLCDIVGTGGDGHATFNISTASSILGSSLLRIAKYGNRASTSRSGSADVLECLPLPNPPKLDVVTGNELLQIYERTNYAFLFAPNFHPSLRNIASVRKELPHSTIFNLLGPLTNPTEDAIEARVVGVKTPALVPIFAEALRISEESKISTGKSLQGRALVVSGAEGLDEISCAGPTHCALVNNNNIHAFTVTPEDFGLPRHPLSTVSPGLDPRQNAVLLMKLLSNGMTADDPILHFVLINTAALFVISGICDGDGSAFAEGGDVLTEEGPGDLRWKEGVRLARLAISSEKGLEMLKVFAEVTENISQMKGKPILLDRTPTADHIAKNSITVS